MYDPHWPDDGLVLDMGAKRYLELIRELISVPPNRTEPVDTWREYHIAEMLQRLEPQFRRILFVCDAKLVGNIQRLLGAPSLRLSDQDREVGNLTIRTIKPPLDIIQQYLDDFPRLTEIYERERHMGNVLKFNKWTALLAAICQSGGQAIDLRASARKYKAVFALLSSLMQNDCRVVPTPTEVFQVFTSCFNEEFAQRLHYHLGAYEPQIEVRNIREFAPLQVDLLAFHPSSQDNRIIHTTRFCVPSPRVYWPKMRHLPMGQGFGARAFLWPPEKKSMNKLRRIAYETVRERALRVKSERFSGSMHAGVDVKRTLRSYYNGSPMIYVREERRSPRASSTAGEPIVWLISSNAEPGCAFQSAVFGLEGGPWYDLWLDYCIPKVVRGDKESVGNVNMYKVYGRLSFCDACTKLADIQRYYGNDVADRIPQHWESNRRVASDFGLETQWWERLVLTGLSYAKRSVLCVSADSFHISSSVRAQALKANKSILPLSLSMFSPDQIKKLQHSYHLYLPDVLRNLGRGETDDCNDAKVNDYVVENYRPMLNGLPDVTWEW